MYNPFKKFANSVKFTQNIQHLTKNIEDLIPMLKVSPLDYADEALILFYYFNVNIIDAMEHTSYLPHDTIDLGKGKYKFMEIIMDFEKFFAKTNGICKDKFFAEAMVEIKSKGYLYYHLQRILDPDFGKYKLSSSIDHMFFIEYSASQMIKS